MHEWYEPVYDGTGNMCDWCDGRAELPDYHDDRLRAPCEICTGTGTVRYVDPPGPPVKRRP